MDSKRQPPVFTGENLFCAPNTNWQPCQCENTPLIETKRLRLRKFTQQDTAALLELLCDEAVNEFLPWKTVTTQEGAAAFLAERFLAYDSKESAYRYAICLKTDDKPIGYACMSDDESHDFGYALQRKRWGTGIVPEACAAIFEKIKQAGYLYLTATHDVNNSRSGAVMQKLGMTYCYSYEEQWQPKNLRVTFRMYQLNFDGDVNRCYRKYWEESDTHFVEESTKKSTYGNF